MKKLLLLWALILPFVFVSCSDDDDAGDSTHDPRLIGEWIEQGASDYDLAEHLKFQSNGTLTQWFTSEGEEIEKYTFKWRTEDNSIIYLTYGNETESGKYEIKNGVLCIEDEYFVKVD